MDIASFGLVFALGLCLVIQAPMNGGLTKSLTKNTYSTVAIIFYIGSVFMLIIAIAAGAPLLPSGEGGTLWWMWLGGVCGAAYVTITTIVTPMVGSAATMVMVIVGRVLFATCIDVFGWFGLAVHETDWHRWVGIALVLVGAALVGFAKNNPIEKSQPAVPAPAAE